jgi:hypothetical protein
MLKNALLPLLLLGALALSASTINEAQREPTYTEQVCSVLEERYPEIECRGIPEPIVVVSEIVPAMYNGLYFPGEEYIFISKYPTVEQHIVVVHETVHYTIYESGLELDRCVHEQQARQITEIITGHPRDETWPSRYRCDDTQPSFSIEIWTIVGGKPTEDDQFVIGEPKITKPEQQ